MKSIIRLATIEDIPIIRHVITLAWNESYKGIVPDWYLASLLKNEDEKCKKDIQSFISCEYKTYVLEIDGKIVGFSRFGKSKEPGFGQIYALYILSKYQKYGYGKELVNKCFNSLKQDGFNKVLIACLKDNPTNEFYKHIGGKYYKDGLFEKLNLGENIYIFNI